MYKFLKSIIILSCCLAFTMECSVSKNVVTYEKVISEKNKQIEPVIKYRCKSVSISDGKIAIAYEKIKINQEEKTTTKEYSKVEERTLVSGDKLENDHSFCIDGGCLIALIAPIYFPYRWIESIDRNLETKTVNSKEIIDTSEQLLTIENGFIIIDEENIKVPIINGTAIIDANKLKLKKESYEIKLFENNSEQFVSIINVDIDEKAKWEKLNKNSISEHIDFLKKVKSSDLNTLAKTSLYLLLDKKIIKYIQKNFKSYSKYSKNMIVYEDGTEMCRFYEFLKTPILFKNKISGERYDISIVKNDSIKNGFDVVCQVNGKELNISFKPYKGKLVLVGLSSGYQVNPNNWEVAVSTLAMAWNEYPEDLENIDVDLLEKL